MRSDKRVDQRREVGANVVEAVTGLGFIAEAVAALVDRDDVVAHLAHLRGDEVPGARVGRQAVYQQEVASLAGPFADRELVAPHGHAAYQRR